MFKENRKTLFWVVVVLFISVAPVFAQEGETLDPDVLAILADIQEQIVESGKTILEPDATPTPFSEGDYRKLQETNKRFLLIIIAALTPVILFLVLFFVKRSSPTTGHTIVNGSGLVLVVFATIFIVVVANTLEQLTAAIGILGAIAGYLFGQATATSGGTPGGQGSK